jgi:hypothetical protein
VTTPYRLLNAFASLFEGKPYRHRVSNQNDLICVELFEDLLALGKSKKLVKRITSQQGVVNAGNKTHGVKARRGDGTFGELVPGEKAIATKDYRVARGIIATVEIGAECKILGKAMIKQIGRVMNDMRDQVAQFRKGTGSQPITVAVVGVNHAAYTIGYEGRRAYRTGWSEELDPATGNVVRVHNDHPADEAAEAIKRLNEEVRPHYDEMIVLRYKATNDKPFPFEWVNLAATQRDYAAALTKISREYEQRF